MAMISIPTDVTRENIKKAVQRTFFSFQFSFAFSDHRLSNLLIIHIDNLFTYSYYPCAQAIGSLDSSSTLQYILGASTNIRGLCYKPCSVSCSVSALSIVPTNL